MEAGSKKISTKSTAGMDKEMTSNQDGIIEDSRSQGKEEHQNTTTNKNIDDAFIELKRLLVSSQHATLTSQSTTPSATTSLHSPKSSATASKLLNQLKHILATTHDRVEEIGHECDSTLATLTHAFDTSQPQPLTQAEENVQQEERKDAAISQALFSTSPLSSPSSDAVTSQLPSYSPTSTSSSRSFQQSYQIHLQTLDRDHDFRTRKCVDMAYDQACECIDSSCKDGDIGQQLADKAKEIIRRALESLIPQKHDAIISNQIKARASISLLPAVSPTTAADVGDGNSDGSHQQDRSSSRQKGISRVLRKTFFNDASATIDLPDNSVDIPTDDTTLTATQTTIDALHAASALPSPAAVMSPDDIAVGPVDSASPPDTATVLLAGSRRNSAPAIIAPTLDTAIPSPVDIPSSDTSSEVITSIIQSTAGGESPIIHPLAAPSPQPSPFELPPALITSTSTSKRGQVSPSRIPSLRSTSLDRVLFRSDVPSAVSQQLHSQSDRQNAPASTRRRHSMAAALPSRLPVRVNNSARSAASIPDRSSRLIPLLTRIPRQHRGSKKKSKTIAPKSPTVKQSHTPISKKEGLIESACDLQQHRSFEKPTPLTAASNVTHSHPHLQAHSSPHRRPRAEMIHCCREHG